MYSPPRRRRRGVWLLAALSVGVVVLVVVSSLRSERRVLAAYIDSAQEAATGAASAAEEFLDLSARLEAVDRQEFITTMMRIRGTTGAAGVILDASDSPSQASDAQARFDLALTSWLLGLELMEGAALAAADDPGDEVPAEVIERAMVELSVGDRAYEASVAELLALETRADVEVPTYPVVVFTPPLGGDGILAVVRTSANLTRRSDLAVSTVSFEPRPLSETDTGAGVIPFTELLIMNLTVTNQGNQSAAGIELRVALLTDRTGTADSETVSIDRLEPAESTSLEFVFEVLPVVNYELVINLDPIPGEFDTENNLLIVPFTVNEPG